MSMGEQVAEGSLVSGELRRNWPVLAGCFLGCTFGVGTLPSYLLGPMAPLLSRDLGWLTGDVLKTLSFLAAGIAIGGVIAGRICDRKDPRIVAIASLSMHGLLLASMTFAAQHSLMAFYAACFLIGLTAGGTAGVVYTRIISAHFVAARGMALGITLSGTGIIAFLAPHFVLALNKAMGWQEIFPIAGAILIFLVAPVVWYATGHAKAPGAMPAVSRATERQMPGLTIRQAARDPRFYLVMIPLVAMGSIMGSVLIVTVPALIEQGLSAQRAAGIFSLIGIAQLFARLGCGWVLDRVPPGLVGMAIFATGAAGAACFTLGGAGNAAIAVIAIGIVNGAEIDLVAFMTARYFGVRHYGEIFGSYYSIYMLICIVGPLFGTMLITLGGYDHLFLTVSLVFSFAFAAMAAIAVMDRRFRKS